MLDKPAFKELIQFFYTTYGGNTTENNLEGPTSMVLMARRLAQNKGPGPQSGTPSRLGLVDRRIITVQTIIKGNHEHDEHPS